MNKYSGWWVREKRIEFEVLLKLELMVKKFALLLKERDFIFKPISQHIL